VSACGASSATHSPSPSGSLAVADVGSSLPVGLAANLDALGSYQFSESIPTSSPNASPTPTRSSSVGPSVSIRPTVSARPSGSMPPGASSSASASATPAASASPAAAPLVISGTVINRPVKSLYIYARPDQFIVVGNQAWRSADGMIWTAGDPTDPILTDLLPARDYPAWFDSKAGYFKAVGAESKNNVPCIHYRGDASLIGLYSNSGDVSGVFEADLWIASDGNYPVSGVYGFTSPADSAKWSWGFSFDIFNANGSANQVTMPSNVVPLPS
jgi:hypothetical protein